MSRANLHVIPERFVQSSSPSFFWFSGGGEEITVLTHELWFPQCAIQGTVSGLDGVLSGMSGHMVADGPRLLDEKRVQRGEMHQTG